MAVDVAHITDPATVLWEQAREAAITRGWRIDAPVQGQKGWSVKATWLPGLNEKPMTLIGRGETPAEALEDFLGKLPAPQQEAPAHCSTCTCTPEG